MEDRNNHDNDEDAVFAGFVTGGGLVAAADAAAAVNNNEAVGAAAAAAGANEEEEDEDDDDDDDDMADDEDDEEDRMAIQKLFSVLQQREDFPVRQRNKIIELAHEFVNSLGADIKEMVTDQRSVDGYAGLDSNRDTPKEVETALRHYPETLAERGGQYGNLFPIQCLAIIADRANRKWVCNPMAVSFVVLFAKLAIEFNSFDEEERGGLLTTTGAVGDLDVLNSLVQSSHKSCDEDYHQHADTKFLEVLVQLRRSGLFKKEDIQRYHLVHWVCRQEGYFAEKRFHFLTNWDPSSLVQLGDHRELPLYYAFATQTIRQFQVMLDCYFQYYTKEKVICCLFQKDNEGETPFQQVCKYLHNHKSDTLVHDVVEQSLGTAGFSSPTTIPSLSSSSSSSSLNIGTLLMMATRNDNISLDGWYYFIRRQPDTMLSMLHHRRRCDDTASGISSSSPSSNNKNTDISNQNTGISNSSNSNSNTNTNTGINDDGTSIDRTSTNSTNNDDDSTSHNNNNNNVVAKRRTTRKRKQRS